MLPPPPHRTRWGGLPRAALHGLTDAVVPALVVVAVLLGTPGPDDGERAADGLATACAALAAVALAAHRRVPRAAVAVVAVALATYVARAYPGGPVHVVGPLVLLAHGLRRPRREAWLAAAALTAALGAGRLVAGTPAFHLRDLLVLGWLLAATAVADTLRGRVERTLAARRSRADAEARAVAEERLRIARDLHDTVTHAMVSITVQAGVARHLGTADPARLADVLEQIRATSAAALEDLGATVRALRADATVPGPEDAPSPDLADVEGLVGAARAGGLRAALIRTGTPAVAGQVATAAYRVVQEALTNALRHAPGSRVEVRVDAPGRGRLEVLVQDDGPGRPRAGGSPQGGAGLGLLGMRERVAATGGVLEARPDGDGFRVLARWPA